MMGFYVLKRVKNMPNSKQNQFWLVEDKTDIEKLKKILIIRHLKLKVIKLITLIVKN